MLRRWREDDQFRKKAVFIIGVSLVVIISQTLRVLAAEPATTPFQRTWERPDRPVLTGQVSRTWMWGPEAFTDAMTEPYAESPGGQRTVQYFDKSRMEITDPNGDPSVDWYVTNGLLVVEMMSGQLQSGDDTFEQREAAAVNVAGDADDPTGPTYMTIGRISDAAARTEGTAVVERLDRSGKVIEDSSLVSQGVTAARYVPETEHTVAGPFWDLMNSEGSVYLDGQYLTDDLFPNPFYATGYPVAEAYWAEVKVGGSYKDVLMQCFERRCLTYTPDNPPDWQVEAGNVGQHYYQWRYESSDTDPVPEPTATAEPDPSATPEPPPTAEPSPTPSPTPEPTPEPATIYQYADKWGKAIWHENRFEKLSGIARTPDGDLVVVDQDTNYVQIYDTNGYWIDGFFPKKGPDGVGVDSPGDIEVDADGRIWLLDSGNGRIVNVVVRTGEIGAVIGPDAGLGLPLDQPAKFTIGPDGRFYISDSGNDRIVVFNADGTFYKSWGNSGSGVGQFNHPVGIALDASGNVYVVDQNHHRVQKFAPDGQFLLAWGKQGNAVGDFSFPTDLAVDSDGNVWVLDYENCRVQHFTNEGEFNRSISGPGTDPGQLQGPVDLVLGGNSDVYIATEAEKHTYVHHFSAGGAFIDRWKDDTRSNFSSDLTGIALGENGDVYVADQRWNKVLRFDAERNIVARFEVQSPTGVAIGRDGVVFISEYKTGLVKRFSPDGELLSTFDGNGVFKSPAGIAIDEDYRVYIADSGNNRIAIYNSDGSEKLGSLGSGPGSTPGELDRPLGVALYGDYVVVADSGNNRVQIFNRDGAFVRQWGGSGSAPGQFNFPTGLTVDDDGYVYVAEYNQHRIQKFSLDGEFISQIGVAGDDDGQLDRPYDVAIDQKGNLYVTDSDNYRVQIFAPVQ